jgi:thiamine pyrophosphate-dependent acetolactate synthase large subunit-like protein
VLARVGPALDRLAERTGALLATSAVGHGLFAGHPWSLGMSGGFASPLAVELLPQADAIAAFDAQLTRWTTR